MMNQKRVNEKKALIDKCKFGNVFVTEIESPEELAKSGNLYKTFMTDDTGEDVLAYKLNLNEDAYVIKTGYSPLVGAYANMQTFIRDDDVGNLICLDMNAYKRYIEDIKRDVKEKYGVSLDTSHMTVNEIEINRTFAVKWPMAEYERVFTLLMAVLPAKSRLKIDTTFANKKDGYVDVNTYYAKTGRNKKHGCEIKWYSKTQQLNSVYRILLDENFVRFEIKLWGSQKLKRELGSNRWADLTDEKINEWFDRKVQEWIVKPVNTWKEEQKKTLTKLIRGYRDEDGYKWVNRCLTRVLDAEITPKGGHKPLVLDIEEMIPLINDLFPNGNRRKRVKSAFRAVAAQDSRSLTNRDDVKLDEILAKLTAKEEITEGSPDPEKGFTKSEPIAA